MSLSSPTPTGVPKFAPPPSGGSYTDPVFGSKVHRVTDSVSEGVKGYGIVPMYGSVQHWTADEKYLLLYEQGGRFRWHDGHPPFRFLQYQDFGDSWPQSPETVYLSPTDPRVVTWVTDTKVLRSDGKSIDTLFDFSSVAATGRIYIETHARPSWDDRYLGVKWFLKADESSAVLAVLDLQEKKIAAALRHELLPGAAPQLEQNAAGTPIVTPSGSHFVCVVGGQFFVFRREPFRWERLLPMDATFEHSTMGQFDVEGQKVDFYCAKSNAKSPVDKFRIFAHLFIAFPAHSWLGTNYAAADQMLKWQKPFEWGPAVGVHHSALGFNSPNWIVSSCFNPGTKGYEYPGADLMPLQQEIYRTNPLTGVTERLCHHRSAVDMTPGAHDYWQEPHPSPSPSGRFVLFGSDWSFHLPLAERSLKVDSWVVETGA